MTEKIYVFDTSVLDTDPQAIYAYPDSTIIVPLIVIQELDTQKTRLDAVGANARKARKMLEELRVTHGGTLKDPIEITEGIYLQVTINGLNLTKISEMGLDPTINDNKIVASAIGVKDKNPDSKVTVVSQDISLRIIATQVGLSAEEYTQGFLPSIKDEKEYKGYIEAALSTETAQRLHSEKTLSLSDISDEDKKLVDSLNTNEFISSTGLLVIKTKNNLEKVEKIFLGGAYGHLKPKSNAQTFAMHLLADPDLPFVAIEGPAGTGKTFITLATAIAKTVDLNEYSKITIFRPVMEVGGQELGFLPGSLDEKISIWHLSTLDTLIALSSIKDNANERAKSAKEALEMYKAMGKLEFASIGHVRGRNLENQFVIVDEAQNLEVSTVKTLLTRAAKGTKIVLLGDTSQGQIDNNYVSTESNGLTQVIRAFKDSNLFGYVKLTKTERSALVEEAARRL